MNKFIFTLSTINVYASFVMALLAVTHGNYAVAGMFTAFGGLSGLAVYTHRDS